MKETIPEEGLEHFDEYLQNYSKNENHPLKILLGFYKGKKLQCAKGFFWLICQRSPVWVTPIVTANIIDIATNPGKNSIQRILFNLVIALLFISQNAFSNYMATRKRRIMWSVIPVRSRHSSRCWISRWRIRSS